MQLIHVKEEPEDQPRFIIYKNFDNKVIHKTFKNNILSIEWAIMDDSDIKFLENKEKIIELIKYLKKVTMSDYIEKQCSNILNK